MSTLKGNSPSFLANAFVILVPLSILGSTTVRTKVRFKLVSQGKEEQASAIVLERHNSLVSLYSSMKCSTFSEID